MTREVRKLIVMGVDPGREKCGFALAVVGGPGGSGDCTPPRGGRRARSGPTSPSVDIIKRGVIPAAGAPGYLADLALEGRADFVALGDRTGSRSFKEVLLKELAARARAVGERAAAIRMPRVVMVDEHLSSQEGRAAYLRDNPGRGVMRLLPASLRWPDRPYDDYVAAVLARRFATSLLCQSRDREEEKE